MIINKPTIKSKVRNRVLYAGSPVAHVGYWNAVPMLQNKWKWIGKVIAFVIFSRLKMNPASSVDYSRVNTAASPPVMRQRCLAWWSVFRFGNTSGYISILFPLPLTFQKGELRVDVDAATELLLAHTKLRRDGRFNRRFHLPSPVLMIRYIVLIWHHRLRHVLDTRMRILSSKDESIFLLCVPQK